MQHSDQDKAIHLTPTQGKIFIYGFCLVFAGILYLNSGVILSALWLALAIMLRRPIIDANDDLKAALDNYKDGDEVRTTYKQAELVYIAGWALVVFVTAYMYLFPITIMVMFLYPFFKRPVVNLFVNHKWQDETVKQLLVNRKMNAEEAQQGRQPQSSDEGMEYDEVTDYTDYYDDDFDGSQAKEVSGKVFLLHLGFICSLIALIVFWNPIMMHINDYRGKVDVPLIMQMNCDYYNIIENKNPNVAAECIVQVKDFSSANGQREVTLAVVSTPENFKDSLLAAKSVAKQKALESPYQCYRHDFIGQDDGSVSYEPIRYSDNQDSACFE